MPPLNFFGIQRGKVLKPRIFERDRKPIGFFADPPDLRINPGPDGFTLLLIIPPFATKPIHQIKPQTQGYLRIWWIMPILRDIRRRAKSQTCFVVPPFDQRHPPPMRFMVLAERDSFFRRHHSTSRPFDSASGFAGTDSTMTGSGVSPGIAGTGKAFASLLWRSSTIDV